MEKDTEKDKYLALWAAAVELAVKDVLAMPRIGGSTAEGRSAIAWVFDDSNAKGSFKWACDMLGVNVEAVRDVCRG